MYKLLLNSAAAFAFALPLAFGFAGSSYAEDSRSERQLGQDIADHRFQINRLQDELKFVDTLIDKEKDDSVLKGLEEGKRGGQNELEEEKSKLRTDKEEVHRRRLNRLANDPFGGIDGFITE